MKRLVTLFAALTLVLCLAGCAAPAGVAEDGKVKIVATIWPEYEWTKAVLGDNPAGAELTLLVSSGVDPHSFQPAVRDIVELYTCDVLIHLGGESDKWVGDALKGEVDEALIALPLMEQVELCSGEHHHEEGEEDHADHDHGEFDEHIWLSLRKAAELCRAIARTLGEADPANAAYYAANAEAYCARLSALDAEYAAAVAAAEHPHLVFADRFPFTYMAEDYGIHTDAAFPGCSAETEASFATVMHLAQTVREHHIPALLIIDGGDGAIARTVAEAAGSPDLPILALHSMQSAVEEGQTYLSIMEDNLTVLRAALGTEKN